MDSRSSNVSAFFTSLIIFVVLAMFLVYVRLNVDVARLSSPDTVFGIALLAIGLITVIVFQSFKISSNAKQIAERMAKDIVTYSHELFSELYRGSPVPYILIDSRGVVTSTNPSSIRLYGCSAGELDGRNIFESIEGDDPQRIALIPEKLKQGLFVNDVEARIIRDDGVRRWVMLSLFSFRDSRGERNGLLTLVDITKQKEIDKAKTEFVSLASHQLRTPISSMKWNVELLTGAAPGNLTPLQKEYLQKIVTGLSRMDALINDFLSASKFELGTLTAEMRPTVIQQCIMDIVEEQHGRAHMQGVSLRSDMPEEPISFMTDPHLFSMAIGNLVSNAVKYTTKGGIVRIRCVMAEGNIVLTVSDTGIGIPLEEQERIFGKIFRATNARTQVPEGTGLGLYIAKEAITVLGGTITFVSKQDVGTTFTVTFPMS